MSNSLQTVDRALRLLLAFEAEGAELGVSELAQTLGVHKSTASRLAATLARRGFLERAPGSEAFRLGPELGRLGLLALGRRDLVELARPAMERLAGETGETVNLAVLDGTEAVNVAQAEGRHIVGVGAWTGRRTDLHCTANGKILLAFAGGQIGDAPLPSFTERTITREDELRSELDRVQRRGWATALGELEAELHAVAAPVFDSTGACRAALSVSGPSYRMPREGLPELAARCRACAGEIGAHLRGAGVAA